MALSSPIQSLERSMKSPRKPIFPEYSSNGKVCEMKHSQPLLICSWKMRSKIARSPSSQLVLVKSDNAHLEESYVGFLFCDTFGAAILALLL